MRVLTGPWESWTTEPEATALTVGVLDGVHRGHRALLTHVMGADDSPAVVTFDPHPVEVLSPGTHPRLITTLDERLALLEDFGIEVVAVLDLNEIRDVSAEAFVSEILVGKLAMGSIVAGIDFQFGKNRAGSISLLHEMSPDLGFEVDVIELVVSDGTVSSSRIRSLIEHGRVADAAELLGTRYQVTAAVIDGDKRGRGIGFPTANLVPPPNKVIPADGIYAAIAHVRGGAHRAAVNVGVRPTFGGGARLIEPYLLDFDKDIYGEMVTVEFVARIRDELRFDSVDDLIERMQEDVAETKAILDRLVVS